MDLKQAILELGRRIGLAAAARRLTRGQLRILCYHGIWVLPGAPFGTCTFITPDQFTRRMERLKRSGQPVLPLGEAVDRLAAGTLPHHAVAITIDDGWASTLTHMVPVLEALALPATLYMTTWYCGRDLPVVNLAARYLAAAAGRPEQEAEDRIAGIEALPAQQRLAALRAYGRSLGLDEAWLDSRQFHIMRPDEVAECRQRGLDIQLHTHRHIDLSENVAQLPAEIADNRDFLAAALGGGRFDHFCYPSGSFHADAPQLLAASGVRSATLCDTGLNAPGADPLRLRRLLDGHGLSDAHFDAYLSGLLHLLSPLRRAVTSE